MSIPFPETHVKSLQLSPPPSFPSAPLSPRVTSEGPRETPEAADLTTTNRGETGRRTRSMEVLF